MHPTWYAALWNATQSLTDLWSGSCPTFHVAAAITGLDAGAGGAEDVLVVDQREVLKGAVWSAYEQGQFAGLNEDGMSTQDVQVEEHDSKATGPGGWLRASWSTLSDGLAAWQDRLRVRDGCCGMMLTMLPRCYSCEQERHWITHVCWPGSSCTHRPSAHTYA